MNQRTSDKISDSLITWGTKWIGAAGKLGVGKLILKKYGTDDLSGGGELMQGFAFAPPIFDGNKIILKILAPDYYKYVNKGVKGTDGVYRNPSKHKGAPKLQPSGEYAYTTKQPPIKPLMEWITNKPVLVRKSKTESTQKSVIPRVETLAFIMARDIKRRGLGATFFWDKTFNDESFTDLATMIEKSLGESYRVEIRL